MRINRERVGLTFSPSYIKRLLAFGKKHNLPDTKATICSFIINTVLSVDSNPKVQAYLNKHGGSVVDLIKRAVKDYTEPS